MSDIQDSLYSTQFQKPKAADATPKAEDPNSASSLLRGALGDSFSGIGSLIDRKAKADTKVFEEEQKQKQTELQRKAKAQRSYATGMEERYRAAEPALMSAPPKFNVTKDTQEGLTGLAALMTVGSLIIGSKGATSGVNAMNAMTGVLKGYQEGNQQRIDFETKKYEQSIKEWERTLQQTKDALSRYEKMASINLNAATAEAAAYAASQGQDVLKAKIEQSGVTEALRTVEKLQTQTASSKLHYVIDKATGQPTYVTEAQIRSNPNNYTEAPSGAGAMSKIGQSVSGIVDQMMPEAQDAAKRSITQYGLSAADQKLIPANWASIKEADDVSRYIDQHPNAVGPLAQIAGKTGEFGQSLVANIKNAFGINPQAGVQAASAASADVDRKLDEYAAANPGKADDVQAAKVLSKRLFSLALQDSVAVGRPTVFLEKSLSSFYSPTVRPDTLKELIRTRAEEAENRLPPIFQTKNSKTPFSILIGERIGTAPLTYKSTADVAEAYRQGKISREDASKILKDQFGVQQ